MFLPQQREVLEPQQIDEIVSQVLNAVDIKDETFDQNPNFFATGFYNYPTNVMVSLLSSFQCGLAPKGPKRKWLKSFVLKDKIKIVKRSKGLGPKSFFKKNSFKNALLKY
jgi:hypothetical protein